MVLSVRISVRDVLILNVRSRAALHPVDPEGDRGGGRELHAQVSRGRLPHRRDKMGEK